MKRTVALILCIITIALVAIVPANAAFSDDSVRYFRKNFTSKYVKPYDAADGYYFYFEQYHHYADETDPDSEIDWVLVYGGNMSYTDGKIKQAVGRRILLENEASTPFAFRYAVYDVAKDEYYPIDEALFDKYEGLEQAFYQEDVGPSGMKLGDADRDKKLTVLDATIMQRVAAQLQEFDKEDDISDYKDMGGNIDYISDFDRDGTRSVMDATGLQVYITLYPEIDDSDDDMMM